MKFQFCESLLSLGICLKNDIIDKKEFAQLNFCPSFSFDEYQNLNGFKMLIPTYVKDYVSLNTFMN